jgi:hypothetical protein
MPCVVLRTLVFRYRTHAGPRNAGLRMFLIVMGFIVAAGTNLAIKPKFAGKDLHQMVAEHFSKVSIQSSSVLLTCSKPHVVL